MSNASVIRYNASTAVKNARSHAEVIARARQWQSSSHKSEMVACYLESAKVYRELLAHNLRMVRKLTGEAS